MHLEIETKYNHRSFVFAWNLLIGFSPVSVDCRSDDTAKVCPRPKAPDICTEAGKV